MTTAHIPKTHAKNSQKYLRFFFSFLCLPQYCCASCAKKVIHWHRQKKRRAAKALGTILGENFLQKKRWIFLSFVRIVLEPRSRIVAGWIFAKHFSISILDCGFQPDKRRQKNPDEKWNENNFVGKVASNGKKMEYQAMDTIKLHIAYFWWIHMWMCAKRKSAPERMRFLSKHFAKKYEWHCARWMKTLDEHLLFLANGRMKQYFLLEPSSMAWAETISILLCQVVAVVLRRARSIWCRVLFKSMHKCGRISIRPSPLSAGLPTAFRCTTWRWCDFRRFVHYLEMAYHKK